MGKRLYSHFTKEDIWMPNKLIKRCSTSLVVREMQRVRMWYHDTPTGVTKMRRTDNTEYGHRHGTIRFRRHWWECKMTDTLENCLIVIKLASSCTSGYVSKETEAFVHKKTCTRMFRALFFQKSQKLEAIQMSTNR